MEITIKQEISEKRISDLLCNAFETDAISYWATLCKRIEPKTLSFRTDAEIIYKHLDYPLNAGGAVILKDIETNKHYPIDLDTIANGLQVMANKFPNHFIDIIMENDDATTADIFIQCICFGDVIYS
jgi:hypothetical protein